MQKYGECELCGGHKLVANYGFHGEYICVDCSLKDEKLSEHVAKELVRRHGKEKVQEIMADVMTESGWTKH